MRMCMVNCTHTKNDSIFFEEQLLSFKYLLSYFESQSYKGRGRHIERVRRKEVLHPPRNQQNPGVWPSRSQEPGNSLGSPGGVQTLGPSSTDYYFFLLRSLAGSWIKSVKTRTRTSAPWDGGFVGNGFVFHAAMPAP